MNVAVAAAFLLQVAAPDSALRVARVAARVAASDSAAIVERSWRSHVRARPHDRVTRFGLATLLSFTFRFEDARGQAAILAAGRLDAVTPRVHLLLASLHSAGARYAAAESSLATAVSVARTMADTTAMTEAMAAHALSVLRTSGVARADSMLTTAAALVRPGDVRADGVVRCAQALVSATRSRPEARAEAIAGSALARQAGDERLADNCRMVVAQDFLRVGRGDSALKWYGDILASQQRNRDRVGAAITRQWRGYVYSLNGNYPAALEDLRLAVSDGTALGTPLPVAWASLSLATIASRFGDPSEGATHAERARRAFDRSGDRLGANAALVVQADMARAAGDVPLARRLYTEALRFAEAQRQAVVRINVLSALADLAMMERNWALADRELVAAEEVEVANNMKGGWENGRRLRRTRLALATGDLDAAARELGRMRELARPGRNYPVRMSDAELLARRGDVKGAEAMLTLAYDEIDRWRRDLNDRELRLAVFEPKMDSYDPDFGRATVVAAIASGGRAAAAFELAERGRARDLLDRLTRDEAIATPSFDATGLANRVAVRHIARTLEQVGGRSIDTLVTAVPDGRTALLAYVTGRGGEPTTLFVVTKRGLVHHTLASIDSLQAAVTRFTRYAEGGVAAPALARQLGDALLGEAVRALPASIDRLVIVADDVLLRLPFDGLAVGSSAPLVERYAITSAPSAAVARELWTRAPRAASRAIVALGDPALPNTSEQRAMTLQRFAGDGLVRLPGSAAEVRAIGRRFPQAVVRVRRDASEAWLKQASLKDVSVLHLATHAWADQESSDGTAILLSAGDGEDGVVRPADLARLELDADAVVLSACTTASGRLVRGEGLVGLTAPLLAAGARNVVATRWRIADRATAALVDDFYRELAAGASVAESLRRAKVAARRRGDPWMAFEVVGG